MKKGDTATVLCHLTYEEKWKVSDVTDGVAVLETDKHPDRRLRFDLETGRCLDDNAPAGIGRTLKPESLE